MGAVVRVFDEVWGAPEGPQRVFRRELKLVSHRITAREVIERRVRAEFAASEARREAEAKAVEQRRQGLEPVIGSHGDLLAWACEVDDKSPIHGTPLRRPAELCETPRSADAAVETALAAFETGQILLFFGDAQVSDADALLDVEKTNEVTFFRLFPLQGG